MPLSWNEIKARATAFTKEWQDETNEDAEAKSFWDGFFDVFGIVYNNYPWPENPTAKQKDTVEKACRLI